MSDHENKVRFQDAHRLEESVEGHRILDTGELSEADEAVENADESVEGHAVNHRPLDNSGRKRAL